MVHRSMLVPAVAGAILALGVAPVASAGDAGAAGSALPAHASPAPGVGWRVVEVGAFEVPDARILSLSPDGRLVAAVRPRVGTVDELCLVALEGAREVACADVSALDTELARDQIAWAPDGSRLAFTGEVVRSFRDGDLWLMDAADGTLTNLDDDGFDGSLLDRDGAASVSVPTDPAFSPDGSSVAFIRSVLDGRQAGTEVARVAVAGGPIETIARLSDEVFAAGGGLGWAPDGSHLYASLSPAGDGEGIAVVDVASGSVRTLGARMPEGGPLSLVEVSPRGDRLLAFDAQGFTRRLRGPALALLDPATGAVEPLVAPPAGDDPATVFPAVFAPDGSALLALVLGGDEPSVTLVDVPELTLTPIVPDGLPVSPSLEVPTWAKDGRVLIRGIAGEREGETEGLGRASLLRLENAPVP